MTDPVYLDHAATTPMVPEALEAMVEHFTRSKTIVLNFD